MSIGRVKTGKFPVVTTSELSDLLVLLKGDIEHLITVADLLGAENAPVTTAENIGGGAGLFAQVAGTTLQLRTLADGGGLSWAVVGDAVVASVGNIPFAAILPGVADALLARDATGAAAERFINDYDGTTSPDPTTTYMLVDETAAGRHRKLSLTNLSSAIVPPITVGQTGTVNAEDSWHNRPVLLTGSGVTINLPNVVTPGFMGLLVNRTGGTVSFTADGVLLGDSAFGNIQMANVFKESGSTWISQVSS